MLTQEELNALQAEKSKLESRINEIKSEKSKLYEENKDNVDLRNKKRSLHKMLIILGILSLIAGVVLGITALPVVGYILGIAIAVILFILSIKPQKIVREISKDLADYDNKMDELDRQVYAISSRLDSILYELKKDNIIRKYEKYAENHICVYVGMSQSRGIDNAKPQETASHYDDIYTVNVYIDGIEYGTVDAPFAAFEVTPGPHVVKIEGVHRFGGKIDKYIESSTKQVKVSPDSKFLFYHWNFYFNNGLNQALYISEYDNVCDFLENTHQL